MTKKKSKLRLALILLSFVKIKSCKCFIVKNAPVKGLFQNHSLGGKQTNDLNF